jgi:hypothetical protein
MQSVLLEFGHDKDINIKFFHGSLKTTHKMTGQGYAAIGNFNLWAIKIYKNKG